MEIIKIISGGQTGVDRIGLEVAKELNIPTGGTVPNGFLTENGSDLSLGDFGMIEHSSPKYPPRTRCNVKKSDGTVYFTVNENSNGFKLTKKMCVKYNKPFVVNPKPLELKSFIENENINILNIAGNRGSKLSEKQMLNIRNILLDSFNL